MGDNSELEEGEMRCSANEAVFDLDVDLSYIDRKVQKVLGHWQKDFAEGSLDLFGSKISVYGSFLTTYDRSLSVPSFQRSSLGTDVVQKFQTLPTTSCNLVSNQDPQNCQTSGSLLAEAPGKAAIKNGNARIPGNDLPDHKPIKFRIKMGSDILSRKVTMVRNDLGLNDTPNSQPRNSQDDSSRMLLHISSEKTSESPSHILREMTAIPVPEDILMSPLSHNLLLLMDKKRQYTLSDTKPGDKAEKEHYIQTQNMFTDVLGCEEIPSVRKRKAVDCFDTTTWNKTSSISEMKKQKVLSSAQLSRENSVCGLGGSSSANDGFTTKSNLQRVIRKDGENGPRVPFAKSYKMKVIGKHIAVEKMAHPTKLTKLKQISSKNRLGDKLLSKMPFKDAVYIGQNSLDIGVDFVVAPSSTSLDLDNWAQCDSCETWRLLPFGLKPERLPDKWMCSMQTWLPGMNHCGVSEEETTIAIKSSHTEAHGPHTGAKFLSDTGNTDKSYQPLTSGLLPNPIEKKSTVKDISQGVSSNVLVDAATPLRSNPHVFKIKNMKLPLETPNATQISTGIGLSHNFVQDNIDQKEKWQSTGTGSQIKIKIKKKKEGDKKENEGSKQSKTGNGNKLPRDIKAEQIHWKQDQGSKKIKTGDGRKLSRDFKADEMHGQHDLEQTSAERKTHDNEFYTSDVERDTEKKLLSSKMKPDHKPQLAAGSGFLCTKAHGRVSCPMRKIRLMGYKLGNNENNSKLFADGEEKELPVEKVLTTKMSVQEIKAHQDLWKSDASCRYFSGGSGQISGVETSSSSKVYGAHKTGRKHVEEVKASPVESVSSSPARHSYPKILASARESTSWKNKNQKYGDAGSRIVKNKKPLSQEAGCEILSTTYPRNSKQPKPEVCKQVSKFGDLACTNINTVLKSRAGIKNFVVITHDTKDRSLQGANDILQEAEKQRKFADCFKSCGFDSEHKEANFKAALKFLLGASLLEMCDTENVERGKMSHVEAYHTAAKLSESCAHKYETSQEMAAAALAYKCMEVACLRVVYDRSLFLSEEWTELQKMVQISQGESPSSSASDVDSFNHQELIDKSAKTKRAISQVAGNLIPVARRQQNFVSLLNFTENMNLAMKASGKAQNAFRAASVTSEETQDGDFVSAIKNVVDFSFHDVEALIQMIELAMDIISSPRFLSPKC